MKKDVGVGAQEDTVVQCTTSAGPITMVLHREWSPQGYARAKSLFERGYYDHSHFFRVVPHFLVQFGISYTTDVQLKRLAQSTIPDDPKREDLMPFREGMISFAGSGPNSRTSQLFIAYEGAGGLGNSPWETPFGEVVDGMENVRKLYSYGDMPPWGKGPEQGPIRNQGSSYVEEVSSQKSIDGVSRMYVVGPGCRALVDVGRVSFRSTGGEEDVVFLFLFRQGK